MSLPGWRRLRASVGAARRVRRGWWAWTTDYAYVAWRQARGLLTRPDPDDLSSGTRTPVVLLPGIYETWFFLEPLARVLHDAGHPVVTVPGLRWNVSDLETSARLVAEHLAETAPGPVVLVAHSKGGLVGKALMSLPGTGHDVVGMVTVNTPFSGSVYATYFPSRPVRALSPRFPAMRELAREVATNSRIVSVYGLFDPHVPGGSPLTGATNVQLPVRGHFRTVAHPAVQRAVLDHVARLDQTHAPGPAPGPARPDGDATT